IDRKDSSHVGSPDYYAEITHHKEESWRLTRERRRKLLDSLRPTWRAGKGSLLSDLLSRREEVGLGLAAQSGDSEARRRFVEKDLQLAVSVARKYGGQGLSLEVLIQEGNMGLIKADKS